jgi:hypothetical protein
MRRKRNATNQSLRTYAACVALALNDGVLRFGVVVRGTP